MSKVSYQTILDGITDSCSLTQPLASTVRSLPSRAPRVQNNVPVEAVPTEALAPAIDTTQVLDNIVITNSTITGTVQIDLKKYQDAVNAISLPASRDIVLQSTLSSTKSKPSVDSLLGIDASGNTVYSSGVLGSVLLNSSRIIINAKQQYAMLFGKKGVVIASPNRVNIDAGESITLAAGGGTNADGNDGLFLGLPNRGLRYVTETQAQIGATKGDRTPDKAYEPLILGLKLANWIEDFLIVLKNAVGVDALSGVKFQPSTQAEFALLSNRIPEILSNYAYVDGISHGSVDMAQIEAIKTSLAATPNYVPPESFTGTITGTVVIEDPVNTAAPITEAQQIQNVTAVAQYLKSIGITKEGATGLIGNMIAESGVNPTALEHKDKPIIGGTGGIGIVQWTASRRRNIEAAAGNDVTKLTSLSFQLGFLGDELKKSYAGVLNNLKTSKSIADSAIYVLEKFEVPGTYINRATDPAAYEATKTKRIGFANSAASVVSSAYA